MRLVASIINPWIGCQYTPEIGFRHSNVICRFFERKQISIYRRLETAVDNVLLSATQFREHGILVSPRQQLTDRASAAATDKGRLIDQLAGRQRLGPWLT
jgi:hypothetical protein